MDSVESKIQRSLRADLPLYEYMDLKIESVSNGIFRCGVPLTANNANHFDTIHAALQWAAAEVLGGLVWGAARPEEGEFIPVVRRFEIDFKRPAFGDLVAETHFSDAQAEAMRDELKAKGRCDFELESVLRNSDEETIAIAKGFYAVRSSKAILKG